MSGGVVVFAGVLVLRAVAAADMPANHTHPQVNPAIPGFQAFLAALRARLNLTDLIFVGTGLITKHPSFSFIYSPAREAAAALENEYHPVLNRPNAHRPGVP